MTLTQAGRHLRVNTPLGEDKIFIESFEGEERVSDLFRFELILLTDDPGFTMDSLLNKPAVVSINLHDDTDRNFHGIINHIEEVETRVEGYVVSRRDGSLDLAPHAVRRLPHFPKHVGAGHRAKGI